MTNAIVDCSNFKNIIAATVVSESDSRSTLLVLTAEVLAEGRTIRSLMGEDALSRREKACLCVTLRKLHPFT